MNRFAIVRSIMMRGNLPDNCDRENLPADPEISPTRPLRSENEEVYLVELDLGCYDISCQMKVAQLEML